MRKQRTTRENPRRQAERILAALDPDQLAGWVTITDAEGAVIAYVDPLTHRRIIPA